MTDVLRDSTNPYSIPAGTPIVGGYIDGKYGPNYRDYGLTAGWDAAAWAHWTSAGARTRRIACVTTTTRSDTADFENFDLTPADAPVWHRNMTALGEVDLWAYVNLSNREAVEDALWNAKVPLDACLMWVATLNGVIEPLSVYRYPIAAQQWIDRGAYDESVVYKSTSGGDMPLLLRVPPSPDIYLVGDFKRHITAFEELQAWQATGAVVKDVAQATLDSIPLAPNSSGTEPTKVTGTFSGTLG